MNSPADAKQLFFHPESNSYVEVPTHELAAFRNSAEGALCKETRDVVVFAPPTQDFAVVATEQIIARVEAAEQAMGDAPEITDQASMSAVRAVVKNAKKVFNDLDAVRQAVKAPFLEMEKHIDAAAKPLLERLRRVMNEGKLQEGDYLIERDRKLAEEDAQRRANEARAAQDLSRPTAPLVLMTLPDPVDAPLSSRQEVVVFDPAALPREYLMPDMQKISAAALAGTPIPGVRVDTVRILNAR